MTHDITDWMTNASEDTRRLNAELVPNVNRAIRAEDHAAVTRERRAVQVSEHDMQASLFDWRDKVQGQIPELRWFHAIPNGQYRSGQRPEPGLTAGIPDTMLPCARYSKRDKEMYTGLYIELKVGSGKLSPEQIECIEHLRAQEYRVEVVWDDWQRAANVILEYLGHDWRLGYEDEVQ